MTRITTRGLWLLSVALILVIGLLFLFPLYWMFVTSLKGPISTIRFPPEFIPSNPTLSNYQTLLTRYPTWRWLFNSSLVALGTTVLTLIFCSMSGYAFGKKRFPGNRLIFYLLLSTMMMPRQVILIPLFLLMRDLGLFNTYLGLILPVVAWPFGIFIIRQYMSTIPDDLLHAATIDGASEWGVYWHVILPLTRPALGALAILTFMHSWNDYMWQLIMTRTTNMLTLPVAISIITMTDVSTDIGVLMTGATFGFIPMLALFLVFQRDFIKGITMGALKG